MRIEELQITHKCHSSIGNNLDLSLMLTEVLETLKVETFALYTCFYLRDTEQKYNLFSEVGEKKNFELENYSKIYNSFNIIKEKENKKVIFLPLKKGLVILIFQNDKIDLKFLDTLFKGMANKLNTSIDACLNIEQLEKKNRKLMLLAKELDNQRLELIDSNKFKDVFLANMSHELKTPLNSIIVISSVMSNNKESKLNKSQLKNIKIINECGNDLLLLINDVLDISKLEAGEMLLEIEEINIFEVMTNLEEMFAPLMKNQGLTFECKFDNNIGTIYSDISRIRQIVKNLLSNALKFVQNGKIRFFLKNEKDNIVIIVKDDGVGIPQDKIDHIFDRFKQVDGSISRKFGGSGLGLSICKELSQLLGGEIIVNSKINKGATFTLTLPKILNKDTIQSKDKKISIKDLVIKKAKSIPCKSKIQDILIVSDDYVCFFSTFIKLKKLGVNIKQLDFLKDAFELIKNEQFDTIVIKYSEKDKYYSKLINKAKQLDTKVIIVSENKSIKGADLIIDIKDIEDMLTNKLVVI